MSCLSFGRLSRQGMWFWGMRGRSSYQDGWYCVWSQLSRCVVWCGVVGCGSLLRLSEALQCVMCSRVLQCVMCFRVLQCVMCFRVLQCVMCFMVLQCVMCFRVLQCVMCFRVLQCVMCFWPHRPDFAIVPHLPCFESRYWGIYSLRRPFSFFSKPKCYKNAGDKSPQKRVA